MLRDKLRSETESHHQKLELRLGIPGSILTRHAYVDLIERFYGFYAGIEEHQLRFAAELGALGFDLRPRMKTRLLLNDLAALGESPSRIAELGVCAKFPTLESLPQVLGTLYVLEGSTLGGQLISRGFRETLAIEPDQGGSFFFGYGPETGKMWRDFLALLNSVGERFVEKQSDSVRAACETFECLEDWLVLK